MDEGISVYEYQPTMMHTKAMVVDGVWSMFGSANFDNRSLELNDEMNVAVSGPSRWRRGWPGRFRARSPVGQEARCRRVAARPLLDKVRESFWSYFGEIF